MKNKIVINKDRNNCFFYILCGDNKFIEKLEKAGFETDINNLLKIKYYSKLGKQLKKEALKISKKSSKEKI